MKKTKTNKVYETFKKVYVTLTMCMMCLIKKYLSFTLWYVWFLKKKYVYVCLNVIDFIVQKKCITRNVFFRVESPSTTVFAYEQYVVVVVIFISSKSFSFTRC